MNLSSSSGSVLFSSLPDWSAPWHEILSSYAVQAGIIVVCFWITALTPRAIERHQAYHATELVTPQVSPIRQAQARIVKPMLAAKLERIEPVPAAIHVATRLARSVHRNEYIATPAVQMTSTHLDTLPILPSRLPKQIIRTNLFSGGSSVPQMIDRPAQPVQTGSFGDPNGISTQEMKVRAANIAKSGGFDLPSENSVGSGSGGPSGAQGVVSSAGFGGGAAVGRGKTAASSVIRDVGFTDEVSASSVQRTHPAETLVPTIVPAEILSKPTPMYTDEARARRIQGEVLLEVVFEASGRIRVVRVVHGLGHGLDDAAVHAAEQIQFKPALKDGQPSDSRAVVHIIFQLA